MPEFPGDRLSVDVILWLEAGLVCAALYLAAMAPKLGDGFFRAAGRPFARLARRPVLSLVVMGLAPLVLRLLLLPAIGEPRPEIHDEFSHLLAADTFAHGRLVNPTHPLWVFFESFHILVQPVYASMYPPGHGLFLAAGQALTGHPWFGVCLEVSLFCAALLWMLRGWLPPGWAFLGASIAVVRIGLFSYWMNSYWGGALAALGGALAAGALPRFWRRPRILYGALLGLGFVIIANSRPYEGFLFCVPIAGALLWRAFTHRGWSGGFIPLVGVLIAGMAATGYYNRRVTGDALLLPEQLQRQQYAIYPILWFQPVRPEPVYRHPVLRAFYVYREASYSHIADSLPDFLRFFLKRERVLFWFFLGPVLLLPILLGGRALWRRKHVVPGISFLLVTAGISLEIWNLNPHYYAPATCVIYLYLTSAMRELRHWSWGGRPIGLALVRTILPICLIMAAGRVLLAAPLGIVLDPWPSTWCNFAPGNRHRARLLEELARRPEKSLVIVRGRNPENEWVYNEADIDRAKVVWARDRGAEDAELLKYFHDRRAWVLDADLEPDRLLPYSPQEGQ